MTLTQLRFFTTIVDAGLNITVAAKKVHATQSGLSKQIKRLEDELGFLLFTRRARSLTALTPEGEQVLEHARALLDHASNIRALGANLRSDSQGELHIATTHTQARHVLPSALSRLNKRFPSVAVHLAPGGDSESLARLKAGQTDIAIVSSGGGTPEADIALPLYHWDRVILVPVQHRLARLGRAITLEDLFHYPLVSYESTRSPDSSLRRAFQAAGLAPNIAMTARDADLIKTYVRSGLGVGILAEMALNDDEPDLVAIPADTLFPVCTTWLLLRRDRVLRDHTRALIASLLPQLSRHDLSEALATGTPPADTSVPHWRDFRDAPVRARASVR
ncbi:LysR substrate-binding domain-containing protein [Luteimonas sp. RIT-PG2_3]